jgi:Excalibur calcium-binding domain
MSSHANHAKAILASATIVLVLGAPFAGAANARIPARWKNCTVVNKRYPHGMGRVGARDKTSGEPVTTFRRNNLLYRTAMRYNRGLDRDKDGIACEKL